MSDMQGAAASGPTPAQDWNRIMEEGELVHLPSGMYARLKSVSLDFILTLGHIPDGLTSLIEEQMAGTDKPFKVPEPKTIEELRDWMSFFNAVATEAFVSPKIVLGEPKGDNEIGIKQVQHQDKIFAVAFVNRPVVALERFRHE